MSKRTVFTTVTGSFPLLVLAALRCRLELTVLLAIPYGISRATVLETLHSHTEMIDLNPLVIERHPIKAPPSASHEEFHCQWYSLTDRVQYLPGGLIQGKVTYSACFHDLTMGLQTHVFAPMGLDIKNKWTLGGNLPGEPREAVELGLGVPKAGLWLREDVDMRCNMLMTGFVKKTLKKAHATLVGRLVEKSHILESAAENRPGDYTKLIEEYSQFPAHAPGEAGEGSEGGHPRDRLSYTQSLGSSARSHSPSLSSQFPSPYTSPSYQAMDPGYHDARQSYLSTASRSTLAVPSPQISYGFAEQGSSYAVELAAEPLEPSKPTKGSGFDSSRISELPADASTVSHDYRAYRGS